MKNVFVAATCLCWIVAITPAVSTAVEPDERPGRLHRIEIKAKHPKAYHPSIGDIVQCYVDFPVVPEQIVSDLDVNTNGKSLVLVGVVNTSKPKIVGSGQYSAFFVPRQTGRTQLTIAIEIPGQTTKEYQMSFLVGIREAR